MIKGNKLDPKIKKIVEQLNVLGIPTSGSCEGHIDHDAPAPWVKVTPLKNEEGEDEKFIRNKISRLLSEFYKGREVSNDVCIVIDSANVGFWVHNGGALYKHWRKLVNERVEKIAKGENAKEIIDEIERKKREKGLPLYQKEFEDFGEFLGKNIDR